jgi:hypothetical protein
MSPGISPASARLRVMGAMTIRFGSWSDPNVKGGKSSTALSFFMGHTFAELEVNKHSERLQLMTAR